MDESEETILRNYAWSYFSFHADQRMKTFNFFLVVAGLLAGGGVSFIHEGGSPWLAAPAGFALTILCLLFWQLDERNRALIANGEAALKKLDSQRYSCEAGQMPHELRIFERDDFKWHRREHRFPRWSYLSYSQVIKGVYSLFGLLGILLVIASLTLKKPEAAVVPVQIKSIPKVFVSSSKDTNTHDGQRLSPSSNP